MTGLLIGYAHCSTDGQDLTAQRNAPSDLGVEASRIYVDHGLTGTNRERPGLREAMAACRDGDTLVVTKLDRLARSLPDARATLEGLTLRQVRLSLGGALHDPTDPVGRLLFNVLAMVAEFEADLIRMRTREGMRVARAKGHLRGKPPKLSRTQGAHLVELMGESRHSATEVGELFSVSRATVYRALRRASTKATATFPVAPALMSQRDRRLCRQGRPSETAATAIGHVHPECEGISERSVDGRQRHARRWSSPCPRWPELHRNAGPGSEKPRHRAPGPATTRGRSRFVRLVLV